MSIRVALLCEDDAGSRFLAIESLRSVGVDQTHVFNNPILAQKFLRQHKIDIDIVVTDNEMPGMTGLEFTEWLENTEWKNVPVVMISSNVTDEMRRREQEGIFFPLKKPVQVLDLQKIIVDL